jgi:hypothetical protein
LRGGEGDQLQQIARADAVHADEADEVGVGVELDRQVGEVAPALDPPAADLHRAEISNLGGLA